MKELLCVILGGGRGSRLYPLTKDRCKPAVPFAGKYRLIDIPISNSLNSGFNHIYVLTQFNSESLNKHITRTYQLDSFSGGFVEIMAAEQSMESTDWFQGTADAVRRCMKHFNNPHIKYVLVLSGDQLYKMDFKDLLAFHRQKNAEITIACNPVASKHIKDFGIMCIDKNFKIRSFIEKPGEETPLKNMSVRLEGKNFYLASMGIYLFNKDSLTEILLSNQKADFGKEVIPEAISDKPTYAHIHQGYWKDIGTIKAFYDESLVFCKETSPLNLFDEWWQFFTRPRYLPPARIEDCAIEDSMVGEGSILGSCRIKHSIIGLRSKISDETVIEDSIIMGADFYGETGIGKKCLIRKAIIDKNVRLGDNVKIVNKDKAETFESKLYHIKDNIVIIPKNTVIPPNAII